MTADIHGDERAGIETATNLRTADISRGTLVVLSPLDALAATDNIYNGSRGYDLMSDSYSLILSPLNMSEISPISDIRIA